VPLGEQWEFRPGEYVEYEDRKFQDGTHMLVAVRSASRDPEFRRRRATYAVCGALVGGPCAAYLAARVGAVNPGICVAALFAGSIILAVSSVRWGDAMWRGFVRSWWY
jgi:hypothetical protein